MDLTGVPLFTFYCCRPNGVATTLEAHDLGSNERAHRQAVKLLAEHRSCSHVAVFDGDVEIVTVHRLKIAAPRVSIANVDPLALSAAVRGLAADRLNISVIATTADGTVAYWNKAATRLYGWSPSEALGRNVVDLKATEESRALANDIMRNLRAGRSWTGEIRLRKRNGAEFSAFAADIPLGAVEDDNGLIVGASADASRREAVEAFQPALLSALRHNLRPGWSAPGDKATL